MSSVFRLAALPPDCMAHVLDFFTLKELTEIEEVNRLFKKCVALDPLIWTNRCHLLEIPLLNSWIMQPLSVHSSKNVSAEFNDDIVEIIASFVGFNKEYLKAYFAQVPCEGNICINPAIDDLSMPPKEGEGAVAKWGSADVEPFIHIQVSSISQITGIERSWQKKPPFGIRPFPGSLPFRFFLKMEGRHFLCKDTNEKVCVVWKNRKMVLTCCDTPSSWINSRGTRVFTRGEPTSFQEACEQREIDGLAKRMITWQDLEKAWQTQSIMGEWINNV